MTRSRGGPAAPSEHVSHSPARELVNRWAIQVILCRDGRLLRRTCHAKAGASWFRSQVRACPDFRSDAAVLPGHWSTCKPCGRTAERCSFGASSASSCTSTVRARPSFAMRARATSLPRHGHWTKLRLTPSMQARCSSVSAAAATGTFGAAWAGNRVEHNFAWNLSTTSVGEQCRDGAGTSPGGQRQPAWPVALTHRNCYRC